jgi:AsmA protein
MGKAIKYILWAIGGLVLVVVVVVAYVAATFDPEKYKPEIVKLVKEKTGRTLTIDGKIGLTFFPKIGAAVDRVALSEPNGTKEFARIGEARVAVALLPLLSKQVIVDQVTLSDLKVDLVRSKDGRTNIDDLTGAAGKNSGAPGKPATSGTEGKAPVLDIGGIALRNANIGWRDEQNGTDVRLSKLDLTTGRIASGVPGKLSLKARVDGTQPKLAIDAALDTGYRIDFESQAVALSGLDAQVKGDAPGVTGLEAAVKGDISIEPKNQRIDLAGVQVTAKSKEGLEAKFSIPKLALAPDQAQSQAIDGVLKFARGEQSVDAKLALSAVEAKGKQVEFASFAAEVNLKQGSQSVQGKLTTPVSLNLAASEVRLAKIAGDFVIAGPDIPAKTIKLALTGSAGANWAKQTVQTDIVVKVDDSTIQAKASVADFAAPAINFDIVADRLDVDRYLPPKKAGAGKSAGGGGTPPAGGGGAGPGEDAKIDLSALKSLNANGSLRIDALTVSNIKAQNVQVKLRAAGGRVDVAPIAATLYKGTVAGNASINANSNSFAIKQQLQGVEIGPLLRDAIDKDVLDGRGTVNLDVTTAGATVAAVKRGLNGTSSFNLRNGAIKGVDVAGTLRKAQSLLGKQKAMEEQSQGGAKTDFSELSASFVIKNGVAHNDDLQGKSPLLRLSGAGDINIGTDSIDYTLKATIVATSTGQGGKDVSDVHGLTAPVHVTGTFDDLKYRVDVGALAADAAKSAVARELERRLGGGQQGSGGGKQGSGGSIGDTLRGILGR